VIKVIMGHTGQ